METPEAVAPTSDERTIAMLAHVMQIFSGFLAPLIIYLVKRKSKFVAFHALQALLFQIIMLAAMYAFMFVGVIVIMIVLFPHVGKSTWPEGQSLGFIIGFIILYCLIIAKWVLSVVLGIVYGIRANKGESAKYPIIGDWAGRLSGYLM